MRPESGQKFKAYDMSNGRRSKIGEPFEAKRITDKKVEAVDKYGCARVFSFDIWRFQIVG
ncbi:MAG: hypothetical protein AMJ75_09320 [Phycisphaerae bacterium SM1_79]|nr:MAG: hypothetical protein AMJ75_09320 [Phycisphaerae bacterium SM1_79]